MHLRLALGTAQFGMAYGAFNTRGRVAVSEVRGILEFAHANNIDMLDTAHAYGESELALGECKAGKCFRIVTKIPTLGSLGNSALLRKYFDSSLARLKVPGVYGLLLHSAEDLLGANCKDVWHSLEELRNSGRVSKIGFSAYGPEEARRVIEEFPVELIQIPMNVFDRRHLDSGVLGACRARGIEIHARSIFLQGFALSSPEKLDGHLSSWNGLLRKFKERCDDGKVSQLQAALAYVMSVPEIDRLVVGIDSLLQLREIVNAAGANLPPGVFDDFSCNDIGLIDPSKWN